MPSKQRLHYMRIFQHVKPAQLRDGKIESIYITIKVSDLNFIMQKFILKYFFALILFPSKRFKKCLFNTFLETK